MAKETISLQDPLVASGIADPAQVLFAVDHTGDTATYRLSLTELTDAQMSKGTVLVRHADGTYDTFEPTANTRAARGAALSSALAALVTRTSVELPGSTLVLPPGADYQGADLTVTSKHGVSVIGHRNVIWNTPSTAYDHILRFTTCNDVTLQGITVQGDGDVSNPADPSTVTNTGNGVGIRFEGCDRPHVYNCEANNTTGKAGAPFTYNGFAHGLWFNDCDDIHVSGFRSSYAGNVGFQIEGASDRAIVEHLWIYNARNRSAQFSPDAACDLLTFRNCLFLSDETVNTLSTATDWFSYIPFLNVGTTGFALDTIVLDNVHHYWLNPSASATAAGSDFPLLKLQETRHTIMNSCVLYHGAAFSAGTGSPATFSMMWQNEFQGATARLSNCYFSLDLRNFGGLTYPIELHCDKCKFGADQSHNGTFYHFGATAAVFTECDFDGWASYVFDFRREIDGYLEATNCIFHGSLSTDNVVRAPAESNTDPLANWAGRFKLWNNTYDTCRPASTADARLLLNQATGDRNVLVWDDSLAGDLAHPSPGTSPGVFSTVGGAEGMRILNKNFSPELTSTWAAEYARWSTTSGAWTDAEPTDTAADGDATPSVAGLKMLTTANTGATTITDLDDGVAGQTVIVKIADGNTTIDFTASGLKGNAGADWSPASGDHMVCTYDGTDWLCAISDNTA